MSDLTPQSNHLKWLVAFNGSLRWWSNGTGGHQQIKGTVEIQAFEHTPWTEPKYRIRFSGDRIAPNGHRTHYESGILELPSPGCWVIIEKKIRSPNTDGRAVKLTCNTRNNHSVDAVQFTAKITPTSDSAMLFHRAVKRANKEWNAWAKAHGPMQVE